MPNPSDSNTQLSAAHEDGDDGELFEDAQEAFESEEPEQRLHGEDAGAAPGNRCDVVNERARGTPGLQFPTPDHAPSTPMHNISDSRDWLLHRAAFSGDTVALRAALTGATREQLKALDPQGNSPLHVAVLRRNMDCIDALLEAGSPAGQRNGRGWAPVYQAVEFRDRAMALKLLRADMIQTKADVKTKKQAVMKKLWELPDFSTQLHWELSSSVPGVGLLLRRYAPHDTYTIWKQGSQIRVDGSLMGVREGGQSLLPEWKNGHFSLLYNGEGGGENGRPLAVFVNRTKKKWVDLQAARKNMASLQEAAVAKEVDEMLSEMQITSRKIKTSEFKFAPVSGWLTKEVTEKVDGWDTKVYEASGGMVAVTKYKAPCKLPDSCSWEDYLDMIFEPDITEQEQLNPLSGKMFSEKGGNGDMAGKASAHEHFSKKAAASTAETSPLDDLEDEGADGSTDDRANGSSTTPVKSVHPEQGADKSNAKKQTSTRKLTGKCWMATGFPFSLQQLLPLLDVVGSANKHIAKVSKFMSKYGNMDRFPVKIQVPIVFTVYALVQFKKFKLATPAQGNTKQGSMLFKHLGGGSSNGNSAPLPADFFEVPKDYVKYEPKMFTQAQEQMRRDLHRPEDSYLEDDAFGV